MPSKKDERSPAFHPTRRRFAMPATYNILIMGASYGSLLASKLLFGGHPVKVVCLLAEADLINAEGFRVRLPVKGRKEPVEIDSRKLPGKVSAAGPADVTPTEYDLVGLAMQEPQYRSPGVRQLLDAVARSKVPCMSIMNMPPLPYLKRIPGLNPNPLKVPSNAPAGGTSSNPASLTLSSLAPRPTRPPTKKSTCCKSRCPPTSRSRVSIPRSTPLFSVGCRTTSRRCGSTPVTA